MYTLEQQEIYIELKSIKRISEYKSIAKYLNITDEEARKKYENNGKTEQFFADVLKIDIQDIKSLDSDTKDKRERINKLFNNQFTGNRKTGFETFENFYAWYKEQKNECYYCGTNAGTLTKLFSEGKIKSTKFNATLHIEQLNPKDGYSWANCKLACSLCNNAKSDLISKDNYATYFATAMKTFLNDLSDGTIQNKTF